MIVAVETAQIKNTHTHADQVRGRAQRQSRARRVEGGRWLGLSSLAVMTKSRAGQHETGGWSARFSAGGWW